MTRESADGPATGHAAGFVRTADGARWLVSGALTFENAAAVIEGARSLPLPSAGVVECAGIEAVDSAAVALLLAVKRRAAGEGVPLAFAGIPASLETLAELYGVEAFFAA